MYIENKMWDAIVSEALELIEFIENLETSYPLEKKNVLLSLLYTIIHLESTTSPIEEMDQAIECLEKAIDSLKNK